MFRFNKVIDQVNQKKYYIMKVALENEEYDTDANGFNCYEIDLQPDDPDGEPAFDVDLIMCNDGAISISKNLHGRRYEEGYDEERRMNSRRSILTSAYIDGGTLIIPEVGEEEETPLIFREVCEAAELKQLTGACMYLIEDIWEEKTQIIRMVFKSPGHEQELHIVENGIVLLSEPY